ncbi:MAG: Gfo/Idh/MocA family oxidoreductase [Verrucomicrobiae bacterium]|nr:Gfo/Idh/MocA family oxidoreductase [Verrucomicrobiae bacterium]MCB1086237.1 Gfo/Idh/MocA family oxidoreductase [Verrucomicrobiae bacterium]
MSQSEKDCVRVGIIGGGLMGKEAASAFGRWFALTDVPVQAELVAVADLSESALDWFRQVPTVKHLSTDYHQLLADPDVDVIYCAIPHHLHEKVYCDILEAGKDLLAEKPFGINLTAAKNIVAKIAETGRFVRCSSEFPFLPGAQRVMAEATSGRLGKVIEIVSAFHHSSDLNPDKPINWKRQVKYCGEIGVMGDLGMHVAHIPLRLGWKPKRVFAQLSQIWSERPDGHGGMAECDTWDNALIHGELDLDGQTGIPMRWETKRLSPGATNTWFVEVLGTDGGVRFSTAEPKSLWTFRRNGNTQTWTREDLGFGTAYKTITGGIFEVGFPDVLQQMWAAFLTERADSLEGRTGCATPEEALASHEVFDAALRSHKEGRAIEVG